MASTLINEWPGIGLPDFIGEGSGDQVAINGAVCAAKKGSFDGTGCVGMDEAATGTVSHSKDMLRHVMGALAMSRACRVNEFRHLTSPARFFPPSLGQVSGGAPRADSSCFACSARSPSTGVPCARGVFLGRQRLPSVWHLPQRRVRVYYLHVRARSRRRAPLRRWTELCLGPFSRRSLYCAASELVFVVQRSSWTSPLFVLSAAWSQPRMYSVES